MNTHPQQEQQQQNDSNNNYLTDNNTLQTQEEERLDKNKYRHGEDRIETNTTEDVDIDKLAGSDRAGTNERKP